MERAHGRAFNRLKNLRESDDYGSEEAIEPTEAEGARKSAATLLDYVGEGLGIAR